VLEDHLAEWSGRTGITVEVWALPRMHLAGRLRTIVHRVIREVLLEIERQAQARTVSLALTTARTGLRLTISDDGGGMTAKAREALETRLLTSRRELGGLGGGLSVNSVLGEGTTVSASLPPQSFEHTPENYSPVLTSLRGVVDKRLLR
jgi:signal transduction histidine kinase